MFLILAKIMFILIVMYSGWFQVVFFPIPNMLMLLAIGMIVCLFLHIIKEIRGKLVLWVPKEVKILISFIMTSLISGIFLAHNKLLVVNSLTNYLEFIIIIICMANICKIDKKVDFFIATYLSYSIICAITTIIIRYDNGGGRISMGISNNPNTLGIVMIIGMFCILYFLNFKKILKSVLGISIILVFAYIIILTGSRKSGVAAGILILISIIFNLKRYIKDISFLKKILYLVFIVLIGSIIFKYLWTYIEESVLFTRMNRLSLSDGDITRKTMVFEAMEMFKSNPIFGVGYNNYRDISVFQTYSHNTYSELLACTGIIGTTTYLFSYFSIFFNLIRIRKNSKTYLFISMFLSIVFLGLGTINFYDFDSSIILGIIITFIGITLDKEFIINENKDSD